MKKLYTLALGVAVAISAVAQAPKLKMTQYNTRSAKNAVELSRDLRAQEPAQNAVTLSKASTTAKFAIEKVNGMKKAPAKAHEEDQWESFGTGQFTDFILSSVWGVDPVTFDVEIEKSLTTEGLYRIPEVYKNYEYQGFLGTYVSYDPQKADPMYIAIEGENFIFEDFMPGLSDSDGDYSVLSQFGANYPQFSVSTIASAYPDGVGNYNNGVLTYPVTVSNYYNILVKFSEAENLYPANKSGEFKIVFPGATVEPINIADVCGDYNLSYYSGFSNGNDYEGVMTVTAGTAENTLVFGFPFENGDSYRIWNITATLNPETGVITFSSDQPSGYTGATDVFRHYNSGWSVVDEIKARFTGSAIIFDLYDEFGLQASSGGFYALFYGIQMTKIVDDPNVDPNEGWTSLGNAKFNDPWVIPAYGENQFEWTYEVELQQNNENPNLYRLVDPYGVNSPIANLNQSTETGYIQFNVEDPDHVYFDAVEAGFANSNLGISKMYCYNALTMYTLYLGYEPSFIVSALGDMIPYTTLKNGIVTLGALEEIDEDGDLTIIYDACFGTQEAKDGGFSWTNNDGSFTDMTGSIIFPGCPEAPTHSWSDKVDDNNSISIPGNTVIDLTAGEGENIYFAWEIPAAAETENAPARMPVESEFTLLTEDNPALFTGEKLGDTKLLHYYAENPENGFRSPVTTLAIVHDGTTGLENIAVDAAAAVEYFNLQGIRVNNPAAGQILIRRQGSKVEKVYVK